jgi:Flp pilus assembly protein TadG
VSHSATSRINEQSGAVSFLFQLARRMRWLAADRRGVSAIEFALLLPLLLALYVAGTELTKAVAIGRKVTLTARTVADLVSRVTTTSTSDLQNSVSASLAVIAPYAPGPMTVTISQVKIHNNGNATVDWSCSYQNTAHAAGTAVNLPAAFITANTYLIWGESQYAYTPPIGYAISGTILLKDQFYTAPRSSNNVTFSPSTCPIL